MAMKKISAHLKRTGVRSTSKLAGDLRAAMHLSLLIQKNCKLKQLPIANPNPVECDPNYSLPAAGAFPGLQI